MAGRDPRTHAIIGAAMEVHRELGSGFAEPIYQEALAIEFGLRQIPFCREQPLAVSYKGTPLRSTFRVDFLCCDNILVELKALGMLSGVERAIVLNYLKVSGHQLALLLNFGASSLQYQRLLLTNGELDNDF